MIKIFTTLKDFQDYRKNIGNAKVGIVPTMGNLHEGHLSLLKCSLDENDVSVITIFVNPKQFGPNEDFNTYPRTLDQDIAKISNIAFTAKSETVVFAPTSIEDIYPSGFNTTISVKGVTSKLEGAFRPTHFDGVTTVVYRLFSIVKPQNAYFGQKDFQQCVVIKKMIEDLDLGINFIRMPIIRNSEGLALSSRNQYLSEKERVDALILSRTLKQIEHLLLQKDDYRSYIHECLSDKNWDYLDVLDASDLSEPNEKSHELVVIGTYRMGSTRLLDNRVVSIL
jgi:pantoate--beta-alanine ligase